MDPNDSSLHGAAGLSNQRSDDGPSSAAPPASGNAPAIASRGPAETPSIPGYVIEREIGRGGSATVYLARELKHNRMVAVKVLHPALAASLQAERFLREIEIIAQLAHPHILPLLDSGRAWDLLYYVTPYVPGESLRGRLEREGKVPVEDAVRLTRDVAGALDYAHRQGVVHRDVKPENILLADGQALVADFGIARALSVAAETRLTTHGFQPGTPHYMSPEQAGGDGTVDARSDIYSLACVLYELVSGGPPFAGETAQDVARKHIAAPVPALRASAAGSRELTHVVSVAMAKRPEERYATAAEFSAALGRAVVVPGSRLRHWVPGRRRPLVYSGVGVMGIALLIAVAWIARRAGGDAQVARVAGRALVALGLRDAVLDSAAYALLPLDTASRAIAPAALDLLRSGLQRWRDITIEAQSRIDEAVSRSGNGGPARIAAAVGAGRFIQIAATRRADSVELVTTLYTAPRGERIASSIARVGSAQRSAASVLEAVADSLLFREAFRRSRVDHPAGTNSLRARQSYLRGHRALNDGNFAGADSAFFEATRLDAEYPHALLWLAIVRSWVGDRPWKQIANQVVARRHVLQGGDSVRLDAVLALAADDADRACGAWRRLTDTAPNDFSSWYGLGSCLAHDSAVVASPTTADRWRFRSSYHGAVDAYMRAFRLQPSVLRGFGGTALSELQLIMFTSGARVRAGRGLPPDEREFGGYPVWRGDSLAFLALPSDAARLAPLPEAVGEAIQRQRQRFRELADLWRAEFPASADAAEAVAVAAEMLGDEAAVDTIALARRLAIGTDDRLRIAGSEVWMRVKFSVPGNLEGLRRAKMLADSILRAAPPGSRNPRLLGGLAALTGRANLAASFARQEGIGTEEFPTLARTAPALLAFASLGGPIDSLRSLERSVSAAIGNLSASDRRNASALWLTRPAFLVFPHHWFETLPRTGETGLRLGNVVQAAFAADTPRVQQLLDAIAAARRWVRPADITTDALLPEASALARVGADTTASRRVDQTLDALRLTASRDLFQIHRAGPLVRVMVLRADLAQRSGDTPTARRWAAAVAELWADADGFLQPTVARMRNMAN